MTNVMSGTAAPAPPALAQALKIPHVEPGMRIGLLGGSFNPPHEGHLNASLIALSRLRLDRLWWIVTPGNPLKDPGELEGLEQRIELSRRMASHPRIDITAFEARYKVRYTQDTLAILARSRPLANFVWIMGADNLATFHRWQNWRRIAAMMPIAVIDRPGSTLSCRSAPAAIALARWRVPESRAKNLATMQPPAWTFLHGPRSPLSSSAIRSARRKSGQHQAPAK